MNDGKENLIPFSERSKEEARENGRKGGQASGRSRRQKAQAKKIVEDILNDTYKTKNGEHVGMQIMIANLFKIATDDKNKQCISAAKMLLDIYEDSAKTKDKLLEKKIKAEIKALEAKAKAYSAGEEFKFEEELPMLYKALEDSQDSENQNSERSD